MDDIKKMPRFEELFSTDESKISAFNRIAKEYYNSNFGKMSKTDFEVLMFDIYIERLFEVKGDGDFNEYSDYRLSKDLGVTQSKISVLKTKKQLQYPRDFDWQKALSRISKNARYENGKIKLRIPDINVYYEVRNAIEEVGGYVDVSLTSKLLQVSPEYFLDLLEAISGNETRDQLRKELRTEIRKHDSEHEYLDAEPISKYLKKLSKDAIVGIVGVTANAMIGNVIGTGTSLANMVQNICTVIEQ